LSETENSIARLAHDGGVRASQFIHGHLLQDRDLGVDALSRFGPLATFRQSRSAARIRGSHDMPFA